MFVLHQFSLVVSHDHHMNYFTLTKTITIKQFGVGKISPNKAHKQIQIYIFIHLSGNGLNLLNVS